MTASPGPWLAAHGKLWYDDPWYRAAWIAWPQAVGLLLFASVWLFQPAGQSSIPWAKPMHESPPLAEPPVDVMASCRSGGFPERIQACTSLLASQSLKGSDIPNAYHYRGSAYHATKQYQLAMSDFDRAIRLSPSNIEFYNDRAGLWADLGNNDRAMEDLDQAILLKPDYALALMNRGMVFGRMNRMDEALVALTKAIQLDPTLQSAIDSRASIYESRSDWRAMFDDANKLIELAPNSVEGYGYRGRAYMEVGQYQPAIVAYTKYIALEPGNIHGYRMRGRVYYFLNQYDNAMADFEAALRIDPTDSYTISFINDLKRRQR
jgi:tetratricopeptide (TPR) repeat protein